MDKDSSTNDSLRQRSTGSSPSEDASPIDEEAQERIVRSLEHDQAAQEGASLKALTAILLLIVLLHVYMTLRQALQPWSSKQDAYFIDFNASIIALGYAASSGSYALILSKLKHGGPLTAFRPVALSAATALTFLFWSSVLTLTAKRRQEGWQPVLKFWWLPFGPAVIMLLVMYTSRMFASSRNDIQKLRTKMYPCKTA